MPKKYRKHENEYARIALERQVKQLSILGPVEYWKGWAASRANVDPGRVVGVSLDMSNGRGKTSTVTLDDGTVIPIYSP